MDTVKFTLDFLYLRSLLPIHQQACPSPAILWSGRLQSTLKARPKRSPSTPRWRIVPVHFLSKSL